MSNAASPARVWLGFGAALYLLLAVAAPSLTGLLHVDAGLLVVGEELCASSLRGYGYARQATVLVICTARVRAAYLPDVTDTPSTALTSRFALVARVPVPPAPQRRVRWAHTFSPSRPSGVQGR